MADYTGDRLAGALHAMGVEFILGGETTGDQFRQRPAELLSALAESSEARLRLALIPLLLQHPELAEEARAAVKSLSATGRTTLQCYYTAAHLLQQKYAARLTNLWGEQPSLPDLFSVQLELPITVDPDSALRALAYRQRTLTGLAVNWYGTYEHAAQRHLVHMERVNLCQGL